MAVLKSPNPWVDGPYKLLETPAHAQGSCTPEIHVANEMTLAHNMFIRGLNAIILQAPHVSNPTDITDFLTFCSCWIETIHHHHRLEETVFFPAIERATGQKGIMDGDVAAHAMFETGLKEFEVYIEGCLAKTGEVYEGKRAVELIGAFAGPIMRHFEEEIPHLLRLKEWDPDGSKVAKCYKETEKLVLEQSDMSRVHPIALGCTDNTFEGGVAKWPPMPWFVPYLVDWVYARKHRGAWRFLPSDFHGMPRELKFLGET